MTMTTTPTPVSDRPAWLADIDHAIRSADRLLDGLYDEDTDRLTCSPGDAGPSRLEIRIRIADALYRRATAAALAEQALHAEMVADRLDGIVGRLDESTSRLSDIADAADEISKTWWMRVRGRFARLRRG